MIKAVVMTYIEGEKYELEVVEIESLQDYYKHIGCNTVTAVDINFKGEQLTIWLDDEGLFNTNNMLTVVNGYPEPLAGNMVFTGGCDSEGETLEFPFDKIHRSDLNQIIKPLDVTVGEMRC